MVFSDGSQRSIEGILSVFDEFARISGLKISVEKSTIYLAGLSARQKDEITAHFPFDTGTLPVRYLGLPLMTKKMTKADYLPLVEKIRTKMHNWKARYLSYSGRLELIKSVIMSLTNFWMTAFPLPGSCLRKISGLCSAFLWSGPELNSKKAKVSWEDLCSTKAEGGLGIRNLKEVNTILILKLIWRILSAEGSLWVDWIYEYLIQKGSFWSLNEKMIQGSWIWRKLLRYRNRAYGFHKVEVRNGERVWFWFDNWSKWGSLWSYIGSRGVIDMGISKDARLKDIIPGRRRRRRNHRVHALNMVEEELRIICYEDRLGSDIHYWRMHTGLYKRKFSTKSTWLQIRETHPLVSWSKEVWFSQGIPKFSFIAWLAARNRLSTGDRMSVWNSGANISCVLCNGGILESVEHLFFECSYSLEIWISLARGIMGSQFSHNWSLLLEKISERSESVVYTFLLRFVFQAAIYSLWRERNRRRHGEAALPSTNLISYIDQLVKSRILVERSNSKFETALEEWYRSRSG